MLSAASLESIDEVPETQPQQQHGSGLHMHAPTVEEPLGSEKGDAEEAGRVHRAGRRMSEASEMTSHASSEALARAADGGDSSFDEDRALAAAAQHAELQERAPDQAVSSPSRHGSSSGRGWRRLRNLMPRKEPASDAVMASTESSAPAHTKGQQHHAEPSDGWAS